MKKVIKVFFTLFIIISLLFLARNFIVKRVMQAAVQSLTGLQLSIGKLNIGLGQTFVKIEDFKLYNPSGYPDRVMIDLPEAYVDYELSQILKGNVHFNEIRLNLAEFVVVKNRQGELNINSLKSLSPDKDEKKLSKPEPKDERRKLMIEQLNLKIGKVIYKDYSKTEKPLINEYPLNIDERFYQIDDPKTLVRLIVVKALAKTTIAALTNFDLGNLQATVSRTLMFAPKAAGSIAAKTIEKTTEKTKKVIVTTTETLKETTKSLKNLIPNPFGE